MNTLLKTYSYIRETGKTVVMASDRPHTLSSALLPAIRAEFDSFKTKVLKPFLDGFDSKLDDVEYDEERNDWLSSAWIKAVQRGYIENSAMLQNK